MTDPAASPEPASAPDPTAAVKSRSYLALLVLGALLGVPVATVAYFFLDAVAQLQALIFTDLPTDLGFSGEPLWWPLPWLALSGLLVALAILYLPGTGGHEPSEGFKSGGPVQPVELLGIVAAALATLSLGVVLGPEAPLIAIGGGLGVLAVHFVKRDAPPMAAVVIGAAGSFAAIATLLGSPLVGAFLLMEMAGLGGPMMEIVLVPGLLAAGVGSLIFVGLNSLTGLGSFSLTVSSIPQAGSPTGVEFLWALVIGTGAAVAATGIFKLATMLRPLVERGRVFVTPLAGLAVGGLAIAFAAGTDRSSSEVLFSGQSALPNSRPAGGWLDRGLADLVVRLQGPGVCDLAEQFPRRSHLSKHVHRGCRRHCPVSRWRPVDDCRCGHGRRGNDRSGTEDAHDGGVTAQPPLPIRCRHPHAARDRGRRRVVRGVRVDQAEPAARSYASPGAGVGSGAFPGIMA